VQHVSVCEVFSSDLDQAQQQRVAHDVELPEGTDRRRCATRVSVRGVSNELDQAQQQRVAHDVELPGR
jgi:hypothetical protein